MTNQTKKVLESVRIYDVRAANTKGLIQAIQGALEVMKQDSTEIHGAFSGPVRVCVRKYQDGTLKLCVGD